MSQLTVARPSRIAYQLANDAAVEELQTERGSESLKKCWLKLATQLEIENIPKHKISTIGKQIIIEKKKEQLKKLNLPQKRIDEVGISGWWGEVMSSEGYTDSKYNSSEATEPSPNNSSINTPNPSMIELCYDIIDVLRTIIDKSKNPSINLEETFGKKIMTEFYKQQKTIIFNIQSAIDHKTKVSKNTEVFLREFLATVTASVNKIGEKFFEENLIRLKEQGTLSKRTGKPVPFLTLKQATKFKNGDKVSKQILLRPISRDTAIYLEYTGNQCECGEYRIRGTECFDCDKKHPPYHLSKCSECYINLYKERILHIAKTGKCENCNCEIDLPDELIESAKT